MVLNNMSHDMVFGMLNDEILPSLTNTIKRVIGPALKAQVGAPDA
jgi:hypothetical protein